LLVLFSIGCWFALWDAGRALSLGGALVLQMFFHELGHLFVFRRNGVRSRTWWLFPLGAVATPVDDAAKAKSDLLPWNSTARLLQAGETANVGWRCIGSLMQGVAIGWLTAFGRDLLLAGGILAVSNLIPMWKPDGSLLSYGILSSLQEKDDRRVALGLAGLVILAVAAAVASIAWLEMGDLILAFFLRVGWFVVFIVAAAGVWHRQGWTTPPALPARRR
jgi:hypothetical protein